ncbi:MAG: DUF1249 domain-containing protein [Proteobacteria bacterium]|nr:DUF1249 domain-containing protein [Pseudomonadota bacterium]
MLHTDCRTVVSWSARPRSFVALMGLYESNYIRLGWLAGDLRRLSGRNCSQRAGDCELVLTVTEQSAYTSCFTLGYLLSPQRAASAQPWPDMPVRVYHDAHLVEAQPWTPQGLPAPPRPGAERELHQRWARNVMLNKWLEYCVERGHRFAAGR